jgi:hypothetical protein
LLTNPGHNRIIKQTGVETMTTQRQTLDQTPADAARAFMRELDRELDARNANAHAALMEAVRRGGETLELI